ncbi:MAG: hypothetical protein ACP5O1_12670 [Phycisphaerae bacterium]
MLIRDVPLADGNGWPTTSYVVRAAYQRWAAANSEPVPELRWSAFGFTMPHLGLSPGITNVMLKRHRQRYIVEGQPDNACVPVEEPFLPPQTPVSPRGAGSGATTPAGVEPHAEMLTIDRPGGLIGSIGGSDLGYNWRLFLNA